MVCPFQNADPSHNKQQTNAIIFPMFCMPHWMPIYRKKQPHTFTECGKLAHLTQQQSMPLLFVCFVSFCYGFNVLF